MHRSDLGSVHRSVLGGVGHLQEQTYAHSNKNWYVVLTNSHLKNSILECIFGVVCIGLILEAYGNDSLANQFNVYNFSLGG